MMERRAFLSGLTASAGMAVGLGTRPGRAQNELPERTQYRVGIEPQYSIRRTEEVWQPILSRLSRSSGLSCTLSLAGTYAAFENTLMDGGYDIVYANAHQFLRAHMRQGYEALVRDVGSQHHGIIVTRKDSPIAAPADLDGKTLAFPSPGALGATLLVRAELQNRLHVSVHERFVASYSSALLNVLVGETDAAGCQDNLFDHEPPERRAAFKSIHRTVPYPSAPVAVHARVAASVRARLRDAFLSMARDRDGLRLLDKIPMDIIGIADTATYTAAGQDWLQEAPITP